MRALRVVPAGKLPAAESGSDSSADVAGAADGASTAETATTPGTEGAIVVEAEDGERFQLTVDEALRQVVGPGAPPAPSQRSAVSGTPLTPREIQTRVRAGESAQDLADDSGSSLDKIMRFAYAVLEERSRVADEARRARARRDGDGNLVPFGETVDSRFAAASIAAQSVEWDSFRRPDGSWVVSAAWTTDGTERRAHWAFSLTTRTVLPLDQISSDLLSDRPLRPVVRAVPDTGDGGPDGAAEVYDQEAHAGGYSPPPPPVGWLRGPANAPSSTAAVPADSAASIPASATTRPATADSATADSSNSVRPAVAASTPTASTPTAAATTTAWLPPTDPVPPNPPLPLRLAARWSGADDGADADGDGDLASPPVENTATTEPALDSKGSNAIDAGADSKLDELLDDDFIDDDRSGASSAAARPAVPPITSGRSRSSRSQSKVPRWDDILLSTRRKPD